jgi:hypothetical protein
VSGEFNYRFCIRLRLRENRSLSVKDFPEAGRKAQVGEREAKRVSKESEGGGEAAEG